MFPVHGVGGGVGYGEDGSMLGQVGVQVVGVVATILWCGAFSFAIFKLIDVTIGLRVDEDQETEGLGVSLHEERGYII